MEDRIAFPDWQRLLYGAAAPEFFLEASLRLVFILALALLSVRLMGRHISGRLSRNELAALVALAAAISIPVQAPGKGLLTAVLIAALIVSIGRTIAWLSARNRSFGVAAGNMITLVEDNMLKLPEMERAGISRERVLAQLRSCGIRQLGEVKRLYMEANGSFSLLREKESCHGLCILPEWDEAFVGEQQQGTEEVCVCCGHHRKPVSPKCLGCGCEKWVPAVGS